ncbi:hypothetical protein ANN_14673 [Periplaneta americana]|uniref:Uncharacterized protein n=1 Tax=Periplaneta americana TaxID=6978 RepID=A0ABQ8SY64_PERAM|nr:hypothetical protein ANN_14673 [Periplaneta americana]
MAGLCEGGNEPSGSLKAICKSHGVSPGGLHLPCHRTTDDRVFSTPPALRNDTVNFNVQIHQPFLPRPVLETYIILDVQGLHTTAGNFVCKELAAVTDDYQMVHCIFRPPSHCTPSRSASWLESSFHGLQWDSGCIPYPELQRILHMVVQGVDKVYTKGEEKKAYLESILGRDVIDLYSFGCPPLRTLKQHVGIKASCLFHCRRANIQCALQNIYVLYNWMSGK